MAKLRIADGRRGRRRIFDRHGTTQDASRQTPYADRPHENIPQCLSHGHADDSQHKTERQDPHHVYPMLTILIFATMPYRGGNQLLRRNIVIGRAEG
jgi:hypothetical protein